MSLETSSKADKEKISKLEKDLAGMKKERTKEKEDIDKRIRELEMNNQMMMIEKHEKEACIQKLKEVIDEKESTVNNLQKELERLALRLCTAESQLFEMKWR